MKEQGNSLLELGESVRKARLCRPRIHCITNYVTINDVANMVLASGGSPIMAEAAEEVAEVTAICDGLVLNLGMPGAAKREAMMLAGRKAAELGHPIIFDPVGVGSSGFRREIAEEILREIPCGVIRGNENEIRGIAGIYGIGEKGKLLRPSGVDAGPGGLAGEEELGFACEFMNHLARKSQAVIVMTGEKDLVADGNQVAVIRNGHPVMSRITGTGCMLDGMIAVYGASDRGHMWKAAAAAVAAEGLCGELAYEKICRRDEGTGSFRTYLIDFVSGLKEEQLTGGAKIEIR